MCRRLSDCRGTGMPFGVVVRQFATVPLRGTGVLPTGHRSTPYGALEYSPMGYWSTPYGAPEYSLWGTLSTPGVGGGAGGFRPTWRTLREEGPGCTLDCAWRCCPPFVAQPVCRGANRLYLQGQWLMVNACRTSLEAERSMSVDDDLPGASVHLHQVGALGQ